MTVYIDSLPIYIIDYIHILTSIPVFSTVMNKISEISDSKYIVFVFLGALNKIKKKVSYVM